MAYQWALSELAIYQLTILIAWVIYGLVHTMVHIRLLIALKFSTCDLNSFLSSVYGDIFVDNLKQVAKGLLIGLHYAF